MTAKLNIIAPSAITLRAARLKAVTAGIATLSIVAVGIAGLWIGAAHAEGEPSNVDKAFWLWLEAYSDDNGNLMDPIDLSELAANSQLQDSYKSDDASKAQTNSTVTEYHTVNDLESETNPQAINASAGNDEVPAQ